MDFSRHLEDAQTAALMGREVLLRHYRNIQGLKEKESAGGLVSEADLESERVITSYLKKCDPGIPVLGEESSYAAGKVEIPGPHYWVLDPLDGTTNFVHGFSVFCISLALVYDNELRVAVVDVPVLKDLYTATKGQGAFKNGHPISVSKTKRLEDGLLATGFPGDPDKLKAQLEMFAYFAMRSRGVRRPGAAAYDLCLVAEGVFDAFWEKHLNPWDTAAGALLVREAGGRVINYSGHDYDLRDDSIAASNPHLVSLLMNGFSHNQI